jgi:hypothetical protein
LKLWKNGTEKDPALNVFECNNGNVKKKRYQRQKYLYAKERLSTNACLCFDL